LTGHTEKAGRGKSPQRSFKKVPKKKTRTEYGDLNNDQGPEQGPKKEKIGENRFHPPRKLPQ